MRLDRFICRRTAPIGRVDVALHLILERVTRGPVAALRACLDPISRPYLVPDGRSTALTGIFRLVLAVICCDTVATSSIRPDTNRVFTLVRLVAGYALHVSMSANILICVNKLKTDPLVKGLFLWVPLFPYKRERVATRCTSFRVGTYEKLSP
jgi:hypothetical protein